MKKKEGHAGKKDCASQAQNKNATLLHFPTNSTQPNLVPFCPSTHIEAHTVMEVSTHTLTSFPLTQKESESTHLSVRARAHKAHMHTQARERSFLWKQYVISLTKNVSVRLVTKRAEVSAFDYARRRMCACLGKGKCNAAKRSPMASASRGIVESQP